MRTFALLVILVFLPTFAQANNASKWDVGLGYQVRLIEGELRADGTFDTALEIILEDGWKTYWRVPGENGIPPELKFDRSENLDEVSISWPAPGIFQDGDGHSIGYKKRLVLPVHVKPFFPGEPINLQVDAFFGVCSEICVPAQASFSAYLMAGEINSANQAIINEALTTVPVKPSAESFDVTGARFLNKGDREYVLVDLDMPDKVSSVDKLLVIVEGPTDWYFDPRQLTKSDLKKDSIAAHIPVYREIRDDSFKGQELRVTVVTDGHAIDTIVTVTE